MKTSEIKSIAMGADHAGYAYKEQIKEYLLSKGYEVLDFGTDSAESVDYPDFVHPAAAAIEKGDAQAGVIICGSGNGVAITANKHQKIRAAVSWTREIARLGRQHNNANVVAIPARYTAVQQAIAIVKDFLNTEFEGGRHEKRVQKIADI